MASTIGFGVPVAPFGRPRDISAELPAVPIRFYAVRRIYSHPTRRHATAQYVFGGRKLDKLLLSLPEFCEATGIGPTLGKKLVREGSVVSVRIGDRRLIPVTEARAYVDRLVAEAQGERVGVA